MKMATSLTLVALGAIMAFAITGHPSFLNLQVTGWVLILTGVAGAIIPPQQLAAPHPDGGRPVGCQKYAWPVTCSDAPRVSGRP